MEVQRTIEISRSESIEVLSVAPGRARIAVTDSGGTAFAYITQASNIEALIEALQAAIGDRVNEREEAA